MADKDMRRVACRCGQVAFEASGAPIVGAICYCSSCQKAGGIFAALPGGTPVLESDGGTNYTLYRKDRIRCVHGAELLREHRLSPTAPTRRVVATCCNSPVFLEFKGGHWLSVYRERIDPAERPPAEMRTMTADRRPGVEFSDGLPSYAKHSGRFMWRLLTAWAAMGFRAPKVAYVKGELDVQGG
ncbi:GFA family protein [Aminobacter sp. UC22_36]|uniref:GFA family protein n=1 Tax=Aminobacter sp. UC22_36 TaxID=3374549 RepID=UPI003757B5DD